MRKQQLHQTFCLGFLFMAALVCGARAGTVQQAIDAAQPGDTVTIPAGVYTESIVLKEGITLVAEDGPDVTILDAVGAPRVVTGAKNAAIVGFTIRNGQTGIHAENCYLGVFDCKVTGNLTHGILMMGGTGVICNNLVAGTGRVAGIACMSSNPYIFNNAVVSNSTGLLIWQNHVPTVTSNVFVGNGVAIRIGGEASAILEGNVFDRNGKEILGQELSATDRAAPVDLAATIGSSVGKASDYRRLMDSLFELLTSEHPIVVYTLQEDMESFNVAMLFPWANFHMAVSAKDTVIDAYGAFDVRSRREINSQYVVVGDRPGVAVVNAGLSDKEMDRYALEAVYVHPASYFQTADGRRVFKRLTNLTRIHVVLPVGYIPVSVNYPYTLQVINDHIMIKIVDVGDTFVEIMMEKKMDAQK